MVDKINIYLIQYKEDSYIDIFVKILEKAKEDGDPNRFACINIGEKNKVILSEDCYVLIKDDVSLIMKKTFSPEKFSQYTVDELINLFKSGIEGNIRIIK